MSAEAVLFESFAFELALELKLNQSHDDEKTTATKHKTNNGKRIRARQNILKMLSHGENLREKLAELEAFFAAKAEWLVVESGKSFALQRDEIEFSLKHEAIFLEFLTPKGWQVWRVENFSCIEERLKLDCSRKFGKEKAEFNFVPRISAKSLIEEVTISRQAKAIELAETAQKFLPLTLIENVGLSRGNRVGEVGKFAQILLRKVNGNLIAVCGAVVEKVEVEKLLTTAILWFKKLRERRKTFCVRELWLIAEKENVETLQKFHALLNENLKTEIRLFEREKTETDETLTEIEKIEFADLWRESVKKLARPKLKDLSEPAQRIIAIAPDEIDAVRSKNGETLRFLGVPFARVRKVFDDEKLWFGAEEKTRQILTENNRAEFEKLLESMRKNRRAEVLSKRNFLYKSAPEAWLEVLLRKDVSRLDPNLILAPLHAQLRLTSPPNSLDLLALRTDGQLVIIELKVSSDREFVFQAIDYWRQVELQRRAGNFEKTKLFGDLPILDKPPLVYLVAPMLAFHRDFKFLVSCVSPEIEIWRYDLNENWREGIKVSRRQKIP